MYDLFSFLRLTDAANFLTLRFKKNEIEVEVILLQFWYNDHTLWIYDKNNKTALIKIKANDNETKFVDQLK